MTADVTCQRCHHPESDHQKCTWPECDALHCEHRVGPVGCSCPDWFHRDKKAGGV